jgi:hypothetical protein
MSWFHLPVQEPECDKLAQIAAEVVRLPVSAQLQNVLLARACRKWLEGHRVDEDVVYVDPGALRSDYLRSPIS